MASWIIYGDATNYNIMPWDSFQMVFQVVNPYSYLIHIAYSVISICLSLPQVHHIVKMGFYPSVYCQINHQFKYSNIG